MDVAPMLLLDTDINAKHVRTWISESHANLKEECIMNAVSHPSIRCLFLKEIGLMTYSGY